MAVICRFSPDRVSVAGNDHRVTRRLLPVEIKLQDSHLERTRLVSCCFPKGDVVQCFCWQPKG